jgi:hypothetical protein
MQPAVVAVERLLNQRKRLEEQFCHQAKKDFLFYFEPLKL